MRAANSLQAPFATCTLLSNAILSDPCTPSSRATQFSLLCKSLHLDPSAPDVLDTLRDPAQVGSGRLMAVIEGMGFENTFRGVFGPDGWIRPDQMGYQQSGGLGRDLERAGVRCVIMGDVKDEVSVFQVYCQLSVPSVLPSVVTVPSVLPSVLLVKEPQQTLGDRECG